MSHQMSICEVNQIITAHRQLEGAGFVVRRPFPTQGLSYVDPFLLLDEMGPMSYGPGEAAGAPDHPHRGFETVTYILDGEMQHADSAGHHGVIAAGDVQWMTAGEGVVHSEMPSERIMKEGGRMHGFQIWVNLPARLKMTHPRYQEILKSRIPSATSPDGLAQVRVIAGDVWGARAVIDTHTPILYHDWTLKAGARVQFDVVPEYRCMVYVFDGEAGVGPQRRSVTSGQLAVLNAGSSVVLEGPAQGIARLLVLGGNPIKEPVARYGPFVMNTQQQLREAFEDYQAGKMGHIAASVSL